jgi:hypothetical protein
MNQCTDITEDRRFPQTRTVTLDPAPISVSKFIGSSVLDATGLGSRSRSAALSFNGLTLFCGNPPFEAPHPGKGLRHNPAKFHLQSKRRRSLTRRRHFR